MDVFGQELEQSFLRIESIWKQIGWGIDEQKQHRISLYAALFQILQQRETDYTNQKEKLIKDIAEVIDNIQTLSFDLGDDQSDILLQYSSEPLISQFNCLDNLYSQLNDTKIEREKEIKQKQNTLLSIFSQLGKENTDFLIKEISKDIPLYSQKLIDSFESAIEQNKDHYQQLCDDTRDIARDLADISQELDEDDESEQLTNELLYVYRNRIQEKLDSLLILKKERENKWNILSEKLSELWESLEDDVINQMNEFKQPWEDCPLSKNIMISAEKKIEELKIIFRENIHELLGKHRLSIENFWIKLGLQEESYEEWKNEWYNLELNDNLSDDEMKNILSEHVQYLNSLSSQWNEVAKIHKAMECRDKATKQLEELEQKSKNDPNRYSSGLQKVLQERKKLQKDIQKAEQLLLSEIKAWETTHLTTFIFKGKPLKKQLKLDSQASAKVGSKRTRPTTSSVQQKPAKIARTNSMKNPSCASTTNTKKITNTPTSSSSSTKTPNNSNTTKIPSTTSRLTKKNGTPTASKVSKRIPTSNTPGTSKKTIPSNSSTKKITSSTTTSVRPSSTKKSNVSTTRKSTSSSKLPIVEQTKNKKIVKSSKKLPSSTIKSKDTNNTPVKSIAKPIANPPASPSTDDDIFMVDDDIYKHEELQKMVDDISLSPIESKTCPISFSEQQNDVPKHRKLSTPKLSSSTSTSTPFKYTKRKTNTPISSKRKPLESLNSVYNASSSLKPNPETMKELKKAIPLKTARSKRMKIPQPENLPNPNFSRLV